MQSHATGCLIDGCRIMTIREEPARFDPQFLNGMLRLLILDDDQLARSTFVRHFKGVPIYSVSACATQREALDLIESRGLFHVCLYDLSVSDLDNDPFYLLRRFSSQTSFVVATGSTSPREGALSRDLGAKGVLEKLTLSREKCRDTINRWALINLLCPEFDMRDTSTIAKSIKVLLEKKISTVDEWVRELNFDDSAFRKLWRARNIQPKHALTLYNLFSRSFRRFDSTTGESIDEDRELQHYREYFLTHRNVLMEIIDKKPTT